MWGEGGGQWTMGNNSAEKQVKEGRGERCSSHWSRDSHATLGEDHGETCRTCSPWRTCWNRYPSTLQPVEMPWRKLQPMEIPLWSRPLSGIAARREEPVQELWVCAVFSSWRTVACGKDMYEELWWWEEHWSSLWRPVGCGKDPKLEPGKKKKEVAERNCYELRAAHFPSSLRCWGSWRGGGKRVRNEGVKLKPGRKGW